MKTLAKSYVRWPNLDRDIADLTNAWCALGLSLQNHGKGFMLTLWVLSTINPFLTWWLHIPSNQYSLLWRQLLLMPLSKSLPFQRSLKVTMNHNICVQSLHVFSKEMLRSICTVHHITFVQIGQPYVLFRLLKEAWRQEMMQNHYINSS